MWTLATTLACGNGVVDAGSRCAAAYEGMVESLGEIYVHNGRRIPRWPARDAFVSRCTALGLSEEQLICLDPRHALASPEPCARALEPAGDALTALGVWFSEATEDEESRP